jgi:uncharacterized protein YndB with AHSA1/START domain
MSKGDRTEVSRTIAASADRLYEMVSDLPRMGEWSSENTGGKWAKGATGPAVGARFKGTNRSGWRRWSTQATVMVAEPGREFAFDVDAHGMAVARWGYRFEPADGGAATTVTEYWEDHRAPLIATITGVAVGVKNRSTHNRAGMEATLAKLAAAAEAVQG